MEKTGVQFLSPELILTPGFARSNRNIRVFIHSGQSFLSIMVLHG
jgi:hypothetical protein